MNQPTLKKMDPAIKAQWVQALRSGEYKQGRGVLRTTSDGYCCLGVLCDLHAKSNGTNWAIVEDGYRYDSYTMLPSRLVADWAGLCDLNPMAGLQTLAWANDNGATFTEIADLIEAHL